MADRLSDENRKLRTEIDVLKQKLDGVTKEKEIFALDKRRLENEKAMMRTECDELITVERRKTEQARNEAVGNKDHDQDRVRRLQEELDRMSRQLTAISNEADRRVNELEVSNTRLQGQVTTLQKEAKNRDADSSSASKDAQFQKENLERVIKELVERNKRLEEESKRRSAKSEAELKEMIRHSEGSMQDLLEARRNLQAFKEEKSVFEAQLAHSKAVNHDLLDEIEALKRKAREAENACDEARRDLDAGRDREDDLRADVDELLSKLSRADSHIQRMTEEAAAANVAMMKLRHQSEVLEEEMANVKRNSDELQQRLTPMIRATCDETDRLLSSLEDAMRGLAGLVAVGVPGADVSSLLHDRAGRRVCWPVNDVDPDASNAESGKLLLASVRLRDAIATAAEDSIWLLRGMSEETSKKSDRLRAEVILEDSIKAERAHVMELATKLNEAEKALRETEHQRRAAEQSMLESSQWMSEAVALGEERSKRVETLVDDKRRLESTVEQQLRDLDHLKTLVRKNENEIDALRSEVSRGEREMRSYVHAQQLADEDSAKARSVAQALKLELEEKDRQMQRLKTAVDRSTEVENRLDTDVRYLKKLSDDLQQKLRLKDDHIAKLEAIQGQQRDQLYDSERKLDAALRRPTAHGLESSALSPIADRSALRTSLSAASPTATTLRSTFHVTSTPESRNALVVSPARREQRLPHGELPPAPPARNRSPIRSNASAVGTPSPGLTQSVASGIHETERASTDRLKAWEARINSLLSQPARSA